MSATTATVYICEGPQAHVSSVIRPDGMKVKGGGRADACFFCPSPVRPLPFLVAVDATTLP